MRVGVVGTGSMGRRHIGNLLALGCEVVAMDVSEASRARAQSEHPSARVSDALPFAGLDTLVIATPIENHLQWVEEAITRRLPFFVEKSIGTIEQLPRWREIVALPDLPVNQVGYNLRSNHDAQWLKSSMQGRPDCSVQLVLRWFSEKYSDGLLESSHEIDLGMWLCDEAGLWTGNELCNVTTMRRKPANDDLYVSCGRALFVLNWSAIGYVRQWRVSGKTISAEAVFTDPRAVGVQMYLDEMASFLSLVKSDGPNICPLSDGLRVLELCAQIQAAL